MQLRKAVVLDRALELLDAEGLDALTMRKLAAALDVQPGALYWHYASKQVLLDAMADRLLAGVGDPVAPDAPWDEQLSELAQRLRQALLSHRDGARVVTGTFVAEPNTILTGNSLIALLVSAGIPVERAGWVALTVAYYVFGHTIEEQAQRELVDRGEWDAHVAAGHATDLERAMIATHAADPAERFGFGLRLLVDGIRAQLG